MLNQLDESVLTQYKSINVFIGSGEVLFLVDAINLDSFFVLTLTKLCEEDTIGREKIRCEVSCLDSILSPKSLDIASLIVD